MKRSLALAVLAVAGTLTFAVGFDAKPSVRDDEVFLLAAYIARTEHVPAIEAITQAAEIQYGWGGELAARLRSSGDIQTYALLPVWARIGGFEVRPSTQGRSLYVESTRLQLLSLGLFIATAFLLYWALSPLGRGVALAAALLLLIGHPFRRGPTLFDPWVMPLVAASLGSWLRGRHVPAVVLAVAATLVKPNYVFLLPAFALASLVHSGRDEPDAKPSRSAAATYVAGGAAIVVAYIAFAALGVIAIGEYGKGVRQGYSPSVLAYSSVETLSYWYRAGVQQFRRNWPVFPWTIVNAVAVSWLAFSAVRRRIMPRMAMLLAGLAAIPIVANFMVLDSVAAYEDGGHFRWINVSIIGMCAALPLGYRELVRARR